MATVDPAPNTDVGRFYRPELDGLRFFAFLAVFFHHALPPEVEFWTTRGVPAPVAHAIAAAVLSGGFGVDLFFCLSSFLITELLLRERERYGAISWSRFIARRALRIWPLYFAMLVLTLVPAFSGTLTARQWTGFLVFAGNWVCATDGYPDSFVAPLWSVGIEEQFYIAWPFVIAVCTTQRRLAAATVSMMIVALIVRIVLTARGVPHPGIWCNSIARLDAIAVGGLLAIAMRRWPRGVASARMRLLLSGFSVMAIWLVSAVASPADTRNWPQVVGYTVVAISCGALLVSVLSTDTNARFLRSGPTTYLGRISYGLYAFHALAITLAHRALRGPLRANVVETLDPPQFTDVS